jgi:SAM-dependent methyltransferase
VSFDLQADVFERRAGLPDGACGEIARAIIELAQLAEGDLLVEVGPGTGQIGAELAALAPRYLGLDASARMLERFRDKLGEPKRGVELCVADAQDRWPVEDGSAGCVFGSRSLHLLTATHVAREAARVASPSGGVLLVGRVEREAGSIREAMRKKLRELLGPGAFRSGRTHTPDLLAECERLGAQRLPPLVAARWHVPQSVANVLTGWSQNPDLGKAGLRPAERDAVLEQLRVWAAAELGERSDACTETYILQGARFGC